jgi:predicted DNA-binding transcriptional regulator AlpA
MSETRGEQVAFGWTGEGTTDTRERPAAEARSSAPAPRRGRHPRGERKSTGARGGSGAGRVDAALPPDDELWDVRAAARFLKRSVSWVYHRAEDGTLPVKRLAGWGVRFIPAELRAWVQDGGGRRTR